MTGGAMMGMMQMAARFNKQVLQPNISTIAIKGNRMVMDQEKMATIYDLDAETITQVDKEKKEHSVVTFAEMRAFMEKAMKQATGTSDMSIEVKETGRQEAIEGTVAKEILMTMKVEATDPKTGKKGEMNFEMSSWLAPSLPGYTEVHAFYKRMSEKMGGGLFGSGMAGQQPGLGKGMTEAMKKMAEIDGVPVLQIVRMIPTDPEQITQMEQAQQQAKEAAAQQEAQQGGQAGVQAGKAAEAAAGQAAASAVAGRLGRLGGIAGGLGGVGLGRRKQSRPEQTPEPAPAPTPAPAAEGAAAPAPEPGGVKGSFSAEVSMIEMTITSKNFSNSDVDAALFTVPSGYKRVKSPMQR
jgi:hypothetical protein